MKKISKNPLPQEFSNENNLEYSYFILFYD